MVDNYKVRDAQFVTTKALPAAPGSVYSTGFDTGSRGPGTGGVRDALLAECELKISSPALTTTELPDTKTVVYDVECDNDVAFGSARMLAKEVLLVTGAGGVGAVAATARFRLPTDCERYVRVAATQNTAAGDQSGKDMTVELLF